MLLCVSVGGQVLKESGVDGAYRLFFEAHVPALGWETYFVGPCLLTHWTLNYPLPASCAFVSAVLNTTEVLAQGLHNDRYGLRFSGCQLDGVVAKAQGGRSVDLKQSFQVGRSVTRSSIHPSILSISQSVGS